MPFEFDSQASFESNSQLKMSAAPTYLSHNSKVSYRGKGGKSPFNFFGKMETIPKSN